MVVVVVMCCRGVPDADPCPIVQNPNKPPPLDRPLIAKCTFDAGALKPTTGSTFVWTLPDGSVMTENDSKLTNPPLKCGLPTKAFPATIKLTVMSTERVSSTVSQKVEFEKSGLC